MSAAYYGHGLEIEALNLKDRSDSQQLQEVNQQLRQEIQQLHQLLALWQPQPCSICKLHSSTTKGARAVGGSSNPTILDGAGAYAAVDRILRQQQVLIAQQQRQVVALQLELSSREQVILEADAVLAEANRRVAALAATVSQQHTTLDSQATRPQLQAAHPGSIPSAHAAGAASSARRLTSSSSSTGGRTHTPSSNSRAVTATAGAARLAAGSGPGGSVHQVYELVLDHCRSLLAWCQEADARIARAKAASAAQCRGAHVHGPEREAAASRGKQGSSSSAGGGSSKQKWRDAAGQDSSAAPDDAASGLQLPYVPAGGNRFVKQGISLSLPGIAEGDGITALAGPAVQQLTRHLAALAGPLAAFAVQLRSTILPALPWVQHSDLGSELRSSCSSLAQQAATAAVQLAELSAVLPASSTVSTTAVCAARRAQAQQADAAGTADSWVQLRSQQPVQQQQHELQADTATGPALTSGPEAATDAATLNPEDLSLLRDITDILLHEGANRTGLGRQTSAGSKATGLQSSGSPASLGSSKPEAAASVLQRLQQRLHVLSLKQQVLNEQLSFLAKCSAAQAKLMTHLASDVLQAVAEAVDAAEPSSAQQLRSRALQLCSQLQRAALLATPAQQPSAGSMWPSDSVSTSSATLTQSSMGRSAVSSTGRTVLSLLESNREVLEQMPQLLTASAGVGVKNAATAAVVAALNSFKAALQP